MLLLSHRGFWISPPEKNSPEAFRRSFSQGFGTETDLRDHSGELVISHDPPTGRELRFSDFLREFLRHDATLPLALNIKADGLHNMVARELSHAGALNYFVFDMSVPDMLLYAKHQLRFFTRHSEHERCPSLYSQAAGVWMDAFDSDWIEETDVRAHLEAAKHVCIVSPELHKRPHAGFWRKISRWQCLPDSRLMLCTDVPDQARAFFQP